MENAWNLFKKWEKPGILTPNLEKKTLLVKVVFLDSLFKMAFTKKIIYVFAISHYKRTH